MELEKKTTILFPTDLHKFLTQLAKINKTSLGHLVRSACESKYRYVSKEERLKAVEELCKFSLPVGTPQEMKRESNRFPEGPIP